MSACDSCKNAQEPVNVPLYSVEGERYHANKTLRWIVTCFCVVLVVIAGCLGVCYKIHKDCLDKVEAINQGWLDYLSQYDFEGYSYDYEYTQDGKGLNIIGNNNGVDYYGATVESEGPEEDTSETQR